MTAIEDAAKDAARRFWHAEPESMNEEIDASALEILAAVAPLIRADQREQDAQLAEHVSAAYPPPRCEHPEHWNRHGLNPFGALLRAQP